MISSPVLLASASPRRRELLKTLIPDFEIASADLDESPLPRENPWQLAERLSEAKARALSGYYPEHLIIAGDTVVALPVDGESAADRDPFLFFGKPSSPEDAVSMLQNLSGKEHLVVTGVCLLHREQQSLFTETTSVTFRDLSLEEIQQYVATGEPLDKAGAYAIQGGASDFIAKFEGSQTNVIGLPLEALERELGEWTSVGC